MKLLKKLLIFFTTALALVMADEPPKPELPTMTGESADQQLFFCTTRIEAKSADGKKNGVGTGFIVSEKIDDSRQALFIVTCRHVLAGFEKATVSFVGSKEGKPQLGQKCTVEIGDLQKAVYYNSDPTIDVAILPLVPILNYMLASGQTPFF